ncbi:hypothetical protein JCM15765_07800 [Paradesulfitobacterium aromaticivorans]
MTIQGRLLTKKDIEWIRELIDRNPHWHRTRLSQEICTVWKWVNATGQLKDMACRTMLLKLEQRGYLNLPARRSAAGGNSAKYCVPVEHSKASIECNLQALTPLTIDVVQSPQTLRLGEHLLKNFPKVKPFVNVAFSENTHKAVLLTWTWDEDPPKTLRRRFRFSHESFQGRSLR